MSLPDLGFDVPGTLRRLRVQRDALSRAIDALEDIQRAYSSAPTTPESKSAPAPPHVRPRPSDDIKSTTNFYADGAFDGMSLGEACLVVLATEGRPMTNQEVAAVLSGRADVNSKSTNMPNNVGTALWRELKFRNNTAIRREGANWIYPAADAGERQTQLLQD